MKIGVFSPEFFLVTGDILISTAKIIKSNVLALEIREKVGFLVFHWGQTTKIVDWTLDYGGHLDIFEPHEGSRSKTF